MAKAEFLFEEDKLIIEYESDDDWIDGRDEFSLFGKAITLNKNDIENKEDTKYKLILGIAEGNYYKIEKRKLGTSFDLYIDKKLSIDWTWFYCLTTPREFDGKDDEGNPIKKKSSSYGVLLHCFKKFYKKDKLYIETDDFNDPDINAIHITHTTYKKLIDLFPSVASARLHKLAMFTNILSEELEVENYAEKFAKYKARKYTISTDYKDSIPEEIIKNNIAKFEYVRDKIIDMLEKSESGSSIHEDKFTKSIVDIFILLNPKYIKVVEKININDFCGSATRKNCQCDIALIDYEGNIDLIEVKHPKKYPSLFRKNTYRDHYVPCGELNGSINQLQQYLKSLTKMSDDDINNKNKDIVTGLDGLKLKAIHPKGYIIFGRDKDSFADNAEQKKKDFEVIKNMYSDVVDIITFDELLRRVEQIIKHLKE